VPMELPEVWSRVLAPDLPPLQPLIAICISIVIGMLVVKVRAARMPPDGEDAPGVHVPTTRR
jgi:hypothetical protein